jgi:hypothetical protein
MLTLALIWIFRKRAYSVSGSFRVFQMSSCQYGLNNVGQVDLEGHSIFRWALIGFWGGSFETWFRDLSHKEFIRISFSESFTHNVKD